MPDNRVTFTIEPIDDDIEDLNPQEFVVILEGSLKDVENYIQDSLELL